MREIRLLLYIILGCIAVMAKDKPNVVFILSDDQSWDDYGFMGHSHLETPNLDQLAGGGFSMNGATQLLQFVVPHWPAS